jgi:hypothetical protein
MNVLLRSWLLMGSLALAAGCGDGGDFGTEPGTERGTERGADPGTDLARMTAAPAPLCDRLCDARRALACPRDGGDCMRGCTEATAGSCGAQWTSYFTCFVDTAPGQRVCSAVGQADVAPGLCAGEHGDVQRCLIAALSGS